MSINEKAGAKFPFRQFLPVGTAGAQAKVFVNHFPVLSLPIIKVYEYDLAMEMAPEEGKPAPKLSKETKAKVFDQGRGNLWDPNFIFDGENTGWSVKEICPVSNFRDASITLPGNRPRVVSVKIRNRGSLNVKGLVDHLKEGGGPLPADRDDLRNVVNALNAVYRQAAAQSTYCATASAFFKRSPDVSTPLQSTAGVLEAIRGIYQRLSLAFGQLSLNVDVMCAAFYVPNKSMVDVAAAFSQTPVGPELERVGPEAFARMKSMFFCVRHLPSSSRAGSLKIRVNNVSLQDAIQSTFTQSDPATGIESTTNVAHYFAQKYNIRLRFPKLPLLVTKWGSFPMEVCWTAPGERFKEALQGAQTSDFIKFATSSASVRKQQINSNVQHLAWHELPTPWAMGLAVDTKMLEMPARVLDAPIPQYARGTSDDAKSGKWNLRGKTLKGARSFRAWAVLYFPGRNKANDKDLQSFCYEFLKALRMLGLQVPEELPAFLMANHHGDIQDALNTLIGKANKHFKCQKPGLIMVLAHQNMHSGLYKAVKQNCEVQFGVPCQYLLVEKCLDRKGQLQYLANVGLKVNAKLGGCSSVVKDQFFDRPFMMLGADCTHPRPSELRRDAPPPSVAALVGSYDRYGTQFTSVATAQDATVEMIRDIGSMVDELAKRFVYQNKCAPERVIYWRDGIGESQIPMFLDTEVKTLKEALDKHSPCKLTVINCTKRHHTRLFPCGPAADRLGNVWPCTVVENGSGGKDIFAVTQSALQGTCRPTRYQVLVDENELSADDFQRLVVAGCFNYARATRSVSLHSAVYYADQVAERAKFHLRSESTGLVHRDVHHDLAFTMWWQ